MALDEDKIQGLKAQEAKDLAVRLLRRLRAKDKAPISPGEVQLRELQYALRLREAETEDQRKREAHELRIKELELQIEQEKRQQAESQGHAERVREEHARLLEQVRQSQESLSVQLERATCEHNLKIEKLDTEYAARTAGLIEQREQLEQQRDQLLHEIEELTDLREAAQEISQLREMIEACRKTRQQESQQLEEETETARWEKTKRVDELRRQQELELARLQTEHQKQVLQANRQAAESILAHLQMIAVPQETWQRQQQALQQQSERSEQDLASIRDQCHAEFRKKYNINSTELIDVTELFYRHQAACHELELLHAQVEKQDSEIRRMREHIEHESQRIAAAVEAAKVRVENRIEQSRQR